MKKLFVFVFAVCFANAYSENLNNQDFGYFNLNESSIELPAASFDRVDSLDYSMTISKSVHFLSQTGKSVLFAFMDDEKQYQEYLAYWSKVLTDNGFVIISSEYKDGFAKINYSSDKNLVIRHFWADGLNYDAKKESEITKLKDELVFALAERKMKTVSVFRVNNDAFRPTFVVYYIAKAASSQENEKVLRQLKKGEDIDFDLLENKVDIVRKDSSFSLVYIGKELGFVSKLSSDETAALKRVEDYKKFLSENKKEFIDYRIKKLDKPFVVGETSYNYLVNMYFFQ